MNTLKRGWWFHFLLLVAVVFPIFKIFRGCAILRSGEARLRTSPATQGKRPKIPNALLQDYWFTITIACKTTHMYRS